jgi:4-amino-4-deoxy-L-arabinose transferase-like glycosyltransferase
MFVQQKNVPGIPGRHNRNNHIILLALVVLRIIIPFLVQDGYYQPHRDEFLYLAEGKHLAWGFMEVPPVLSIFAWLINLAGGGMFWIKFWPNLIGGACFFLAGKIIFSLNGGKFALILAFLSFTFGAYLRTFHLFQPNFLDVFFWTLIGYCVIRFIQTQKNSWLYMLGISVGLGMMSKYTVGFYTTSVLAGLLISKQRKIFLNPHLYIAGAIALLIFLPNLLWQYNHNFPVFAHMDELQETQLQYNQTGQFISEQFMMHLPVVYVWLAGLLFIIFAEEGKKYRFYAWAFLFVVLLMIYLKGKAYYILGIYPVLFAFGAAWLEKLTLVSFRWTRYAMGVVTLALGALALPLLMPVFKPEGLTKYYEAVGAYKSGDFKWEDQKRHPLPQDFADMIGWKETTAMTARAYHSLPDSMKKHTIVFGSSYAFAGCLNFYGPALGLPEVYSTNASFLWWIPKKLEFDHMLYIDDDYSKENPIFKQFEKVSVLDSVNLPFFRENGTKVFLFENASDSFNPMVAGYVAALKAKFKR